MPQKCPMHEGREQGCLRPCSSAAARPKERQREREREGRQCGSQRPDTYDSSKDSLYDTPFTKLQPVLVAEVVCVSGGNGEMADDIRGGGFAFLSVCPSRPPSPCSNSNSRAMSYEAYDINALCRGDNTCIHHEHCGELVSGSMEALKNSTASLKN